MVKIRKSESSGPPELDILAAQLKVLDADLTLEEKEVRPENGRAFMAEPNLNLRIEVLKNLVEPGIFEGKTFFDRFKLKKDENGEWAFLKYSKLGNLIRLRYGEKWFADEEAEFEETDFEGFEFIAKVEPRTDAKGNALPGSTINWKSMRPADKHAEAEIRRAQEVLDEAEEEFEDSPL
jgi:hypothetical protein